MPNTLAHIAVHGLLTRTLIRGADLRWIVLGCIIPDLPWIVRRILKVVVPSLSQWEYCGLYFHIQTSLLFCLILALVFALFSDRFKQVLLILGSGSLIHLLLDACQEKWGNGVILAAPFKWQLFSFDLFIIESVPTYLLTLTGLIYLLLLWRRTLSEPLNFSFSTLRMWVAMIALVVYFALPLSMFDGPVATDMGYIRTWLFAAERTGKPIEMDRATYVRRESAPDYLLLPSQRRIYVENLALEHSAMVSVRGVFLQPERIRVDQFRVHPKGLRDYSSYLGLGLICGLWLISLPAVSARLRQRKVCFDES